MLNALQMSWPMEIFAAAQIKVASKLLKATHASDRKTAAYDYTGIAKDVY